MSVHDYPPDLSGRSIRPVDPKCKISVHVLPDLSPLPVQNVTDEKTSVPEPLMPFLFGSPTGPQNDIFTYAVLDGAKILGLQERLAAFGLDHLCLYTAMDGDPLTEVAPWLVELRQDNPLTAELFTRSDAPWHLWDRAAGIFLRSTAPIDLLKSHLKKFVQVDVGSGRRVFFRFWEARLLAHYALCHHPEAEAHLSAFLGNAGLIAVDPFNARAILVKGGAGPRPPGPWPMLREDLAAAQLTVFCEDWSLRIQEPVPPLREFDKADRLALVTRLVHQARQVGFRENKSVERYCISAILLGAPPETDDRLVPLLQSPQHELDRSRKLLKEVKALRGNG